MRQDLVAGRLRGSVMRVIGAWGPAAAYARSIVKSLAVSIAVIAVVLAAGSANAAAGPRQTFTDPFTQTAPGVSSGSELTIVYLNPNDPNAKPPPVRHVVITLQPGARIDTSVPAACAASDAQLQAQGDAACPVASRVGGGEIDIATGFPAPGDIVKTDVSLFNAPGQMIFLVKRQGTQMVVTSARAQISGATITSDAMPTPGGPPDGQSALKLVRLTLNPISTQAGAYITTPPTCPPGGSWTNQAAFTYADGVTETVTSASACVASAHSTPVSTRRSAGKRRRGARHRRARGRRVSAPRFTG